LRGAAAMAPIIRSLSERLRRDCSPAENFRPQDAQVVDGISKSDVDCDGVH
jgi:hypothetical protein